MTTDGGQEWESLYTELAALTDEDRRQAFLGKHPQLLDAQVVQHLAEVIRTERLADRQKALRLAEAAVSIGRRIGDPRTLARGLRAKANVLSVLGLNPDALALHHEALELFRQQRDQAEVAKSLSASLQPLILLGEYERALAAAESARGILTELGDELRLARLEINVGNILHRQDRFVEALACYEKAYEKLAPLGEREGVAAALHNMAVCKIGLHDSHGALKIYEEARAFSEAHGLPLVAAQAEYNIAYLYFHRGQYSRAIETLRTVREACERNGDRYHVALCYMDLAEIYLDLNLSQEAAESASEALRQFRDLSMGYEYAKSVAYLGIASSQLGQAMRAVELLTEARALFVRENNHVWPALLDLYVALVFYDEGRFFESRQLTATSLEFFTSARIPGKAILCQLHLARLSLQLGERTAARAECAAALDLLAPLDMPTLCCQAHFVMSQIEEAAGRLEQAYQSCQQARRSLETLRANLHSEELKIAFMKNRLGVFESLVELALRLHPGAEGAVEVFTYVEQAKSRSLRDAILSGAHGWFREEPGQNTQVLKIRDLRQELIWSYHSIEQGQLEQRRSPEELRDLESRARTQEDDLLRALRELRTSETEADRLQDSEPVSLEVLRVALGPEATLVEYFRVRDHMMAMVINQDVIEMLPLAPMSRIKSLLRLLQFQLSKFRLGASYAERFQESLLRPTQAHLQELYEETVAPLRPLLRGSHLVFAPHDALHYLPFHALFDGQQYLIDEFTVSYAPSASVFALCQGKPAHGGVGSLVLGVPDPQTPFIHDEVRAVAAVLPHPELFLGAQAGMAVLKEKGQTSRIIHIATHGYFRRDNPMFSGIRLGDSHLSLYDLYQLQLPAELVTLSGCGTGLSALAAGDELLGLVRGLLCAGAHTLLLTMWDVQDESTAEFMTCFYRQLRRRSSSAHALREAMRGLRQRYSHPYYWSPFLLVGKAIQAGT